MEPVKANELYLTLSECQLHEELAPIIDGYLAIKTLMDKAGFLSDSEVDEGINESLKLRFDNLLRFTGLCLEIVINPDPVVIELRKEFNTHIFIIIMEIKEALEALKDKDQIIKNFEELKNLIKRFNDLMSKNKLMRLIS